MSKKMKVTKCVPIERCDGSPSVAMSRISNAVACRESRAILLWLTDYAKLRRAWRLVEELADTATDGVAAANRKDTLIFDARRIVGKK